MPAYKFKHTVTEHQQLLIQTKKYLVLQFLKLLYGITMLYI